jgi:hypothetical protein
MEGEVACLSAEWGASGQAWSVPITGKAKRKPTLFERYRDEARGGESFAEWLALRSGA